VLKDVRDFDPADKLGAAVLSHEEAMKTKLLPN